MMSTAELATEMRTWEEKILEHSLGIPNHMVGGVQRYVLYGIPMGDFGTALFANDFMEAASRADLVNLHALHHWATLLYNGVPRACRGSRDVVDLWIKSGGLKGLHEALEEDDD